MIYQHAIAEQNWVEKEGKIKLIGVNLYPKLEKTNLEQLYNAKEIKPVRWAEMFE